MSGPLGWIEGAASSLVKPFENIKNLEGQGLGDGAPAAAASPPKKEAKKATKKADTPTSAEQTKAIEKELSSGPWAQLSQALVKQYDAELTPVTAAVSGSTNATGQTDAASQALASLGLSPSSNAGQWLESNMASANASAAPVTAAMNAYGQQYAAEAGPITKALQAYGQANELEVSTAPEQSWLNALASHITSNLSYGGDVPVADVGNGGITPAVAKALQESGGYGASGATGNGLIPVSDIGAKNGQAVVNPNAATASAALSGAGSVPGASTNAGSG
jgi:hypothetical protein